MLNSLRRALRCGLLAFCVVFVSLVSVMPMNAVAADIDVFGRPVQAASSAQASTPAAAPMPEPGHTIVLPEFARTVLATALIWQGRLNERIADAAAQLHRGSTPWVWLTLLAFSFAYGVLHAIGPGHGKLITGAYLGSRSTRVVPAIALAAWSATVQAASAIVLVFGAVWFAKAGMTRVLSNAASLEIVSYLLLCVAGLFTLYNALTRRDCCVDPRTLKLVPDDGEVVDHAPAYLGTKLRLHARESGAAMKLARPQSPGSVAAQILAIGFAAGIRPCAGSIFVLIAAVAAHAPWVGIAAAFAIGAGVAVTVTLFGLGALAANRFVMGRGIRMRTRIRATQRVVAVAGAVVIVLFGGVQAALMFSGYLQPSLT